MHTVDGFIRDTHQRYVETSLGSIAVYVRHVASDALPVIFLHGVYFDHHMWNEQIAAIDARTTITIDMPLHGQSRIGIRDEWTLRDCAEMLVEILDALGIGHVVAVGHSWGSMTILRAAYQHSGRFAGVALCNMPYLKPTRTQKLLFRMNHTLLRCRGFYTRQAAKALFGRTSIAEKPDLVHQLKRPMDVLSNEQIEHIDRAVIFDADDASGMLEALTVKAVALKGEDDYVPTPPGNIPTVVVNGGHVSPLERPDDVLELVRNLLLATPG